MLSAAFQKAYGREPTIAERARMMAFGIDREADERRRLRRVVAAFDRQTHPTGVRCKLQPEDVLYHVSRGVTFALDRHDVSVSGEIMAPGGYEPHLTAFIERTLRPGMRVCNVGANVGYYVGICARAVGPQGRVSAIEPQTDNCRLILLTAERNGFANVDVYPVACGRGFGHALFSTFLGSNGGLMSGVVPDAACDIVPMVTLDGLPLGVVDFLLMDCEGAEAMVASGGSRILDQRPIIASEFSQEMLSRVSGVSGRDYLQMFLDRGYTIHALDRAGRTNALTPIANVDAWLADWPSVTRIEDLVFLP